MVSAGMFYPSSAPPVLEKGGSLLLWDQGQEVCALKDAAAAGGMQGEGYRVAPLSGRRFATALLGGGVAVWDSATKRLLHHYHGHFRSASTALTGVVSCVAALPAGFVASSGPDKAVHIWNSATAEEDGRVLEGHGEEVLALAMLPDGRLASGARDCSVRLWDLASRSCTAVLLHEAVEGLPAPHVHALAALEGGIFATGCGDGRLCLWSAAACKLEAALEGHSGVVCAVKALPQGLLASGGGDSTVRIWCVVSHVCIAVLGAHLGPVQGLAVLKGGFLATACLGENTIRLWDRFLPAANPPPTAPATAGPPCPTCTLRTLVGAGKVLGAHFNLCPFCVHVLPGTAPPEPVTPPPEPPGEEEAAEYGCPASEDVEPAASKYTIGIDIGTFESKGVLMRVSDGTAIKCQLSRPHDLITPCAGYAEHDAETSWWGDLVFLVRGLLAESGVNPSEVACLATSAIGPCMLPLDAQGQPLCNAALYGVDTRATSQIAELESIIGRDAILAKCGNSLTSQSVGPKILWLKQQRPDLYARTSMIVSATSFLTHRLTGKFVTDHLTAAGFAPLYSVHKQEWQAVEGGAAGEPIIIPLSKLPRIAWSTELIEGGLCASAAKILGLPEGLPVTVGTIDAAAEAVSVGVVVPEEGGAVGGAAAAPAPGTMLMYGSTMFTISLRSSMPPLDGTLWYSPWLFPGVHSVNGGQATSGTLTHWLRDTVGGGKGSKEPSFEALVEEARASPKGAKALLCLPYFSGERTPLHDPKALGCFFGLTLVHTRGDLFRAALEGIASGTAHMLEAMGHIGAGESGAAQRQAPRRVRAVGGGTKNAVWMQATSDLCGLTQELCKVSMGASFGNAFLAALACGLATVQDIKAWNPVLPERAVLPGEGREVYARQYPLWKALYTQTRDIAHALATPLTAAPSAQAVSPAQARESTES